jgi:hypothetical protein
MKKATPPAASRELANSARSRRAQQQDLAPTNRLAQLPALTNGNPVQALAQLRDDIHQSFHVQNLVGVSAESNDGTPVQLRASLELGDARLEREPAHFAGPALSALLDELETAAALATHLAAQADAKAPSEDMIARLQKLRAIAEGTDEPAKAMVLAALRSELDHSGASPAAAVPVQRQVVQANGRSIGIAAGAAALVVGLGFLAKWTYEYIRDQREDALVEAYARTGHVPAQPIPAELTAGIAALPTNAQKAARLFQNINHFRFRYTGQAIRNAHLAFQARQGDCQTLVSMYHEVAQSMGIPITIGQQDGPMLVAPQPIHGRNTTSNTEDGTAWYFTEHYWAIGAGTNYDVLFMATPPPAFVLSVGSVVHNNVRYETFADGRAAIEQGADHLNYAIQGQALVFPNAGAAVAFINAHP